MMHINMPCGIMQNSLMLLQVARLIPLGFRRLKYAAETRIWTKAKNSRIKMADTTLVRSREGRSSGGKI
jgi:hypothetical protein